MDRPEVLAWLREGDPARLEELWRRADAARREGVGDEVHLRGLVELSSHCVRSCGYCGLRAPNAGLRRYRMSDAEVLECALKAEDFGYGTVVLQSGEDPGLDADRVAGLVRGIKVRTRLAVTLSLGERADDELEAWREAGADRYLLRFETSDERLYGLIHPDLPGRPSDRIAMLGRLRTMGYETGSGVMVGIPGQTLESLADDILLFRAFDLDMIGIGPYLPHPATPLGAGQWRRPVLEDEQAPSSAEMACKVLALARLACPRANIPSTTALATLDRENGRELGLRRGANVVMPNLTPPGCRELYEIYPSKACANETAENCRGCLETRLRSMGRIPGKGPGGRRHTLST